MIDRSQPAPPRLSGHQQGSVCGRSREHQIRMSAQMLPRRRHIAPLLSSCAPPDKIIIRARRLVFASASRTRSLPSWAAGDNKHAQSCIYDSRWAAAANCQLVINGFLRQSCRARALRLSFRLHATGQKIARACIAHAPAPLPARQESAAPLIWRRGGAVAE